MITDDLIAQGYVIGLDINSNAGKLNFKDVKESNPSLSFVRAKSSEGTSLDFLWSYNKKTAANAGFKIGSFHVFEDAEDVASQAGGYTSIAADTDLPPAIALFHCKTNIYKAMDGLLSTLAKTTQSWGRTPSILTTQLMMSSVPQKYYADILKYPLSLVQEGVSQPLVPNPWGQTGDWKTSLFNWHFLSQPIVVGGAKVSFSAFLDKKTGK